ncbi:MAG: TauD/TfdA family dioxygenase [Acidobacteria bacterium]|nr:TauD/TfdA family dioxygenase [Acidobacteriota bacterium]
MNIIKAPINASTAWLGKTMSLESNWIHKLQGSELAEINTALEKAKSTNKPLPELTYKDFPLTNLIATIKSWLKELNDGLGFLLIKGLPVQNYSQQEIEIIYYGLSLYLGKPVSQNAAGDLIGHVRDTGANSKNPGVRLYQTREKQDFHCDGSDLVGLLCLKRAKSGGLSRIVSSMSIYNKILESRPDLVDLLYQPMYFDRNNEEPIGEPPFFPLPICHINQGKLRFFYIGWYIRKAQRHKEVPRLTKQQLELLELIELTANDSEYYLDMDFDVGDIQFLNNGVILHSRTEYEDYDEVELKRHLLRLWLKTHDFSVVEDILREGILARSNQ